MTVKSLTKKTTKEHEEYGMGKEQERVGKDCTTTTSDEQSSSDNKTLNLVIPNLEANCSENLSSPEPSIQEDTFIRGIDYKQMVQRNIVAQKDNSCSSDALKNTPSAQSFHLYENITTNAKQLEGNICSERQNWVYW